METDDRERQVAFHEAAHCIGFLWMGWPVLMLKIDGRGGWCLPAVGADAEVQLTAVMMGAIGEQLTGAWDSAPSSADEDILRAAGRQLNVAPKQWERLRRRCEHLVWAHAEEITFLAEQLLAEREMESLALGNLCRASNSPLSAYAPLYEKYRPAAPGLQRRGRSADAAPSSSTRGRRTVVSTNCRIIG